MELLNGLTPNIIAPLIVRGVPSVELFLNHLLICDMTLEIIPADGGFHIGFRKEIEVETVNEDGTKTVEFQEKFTKITSVAYVHLANSDQHELFFERLQKAFQRFETNLKKQAEQIELQNEIDKLEEKKKQLQLNESA